MVLREFLNLEKGAAVTEPKDPKNATVIFGLKNSCPRLGSSLAGAKVKVSGCISHQNRFDTFTLFLCQVVGEHGFTSFRSAYHAFPHHDISGLNAKEAFQRRCERLMEMVSSGKNDASARPLLLVRVCACLEELDQSEELYNLLRLLGCLVVRFCGKRW